MKIIIVEMVDGQIKTTEIQGTTTRHYRRALREAGPYRRVYTFPLTEPNPLGRAKSDFLAERRERQLQADLCAAYASCM